jgi:predicted CoA-binding protein
VKSGDHYVVTITRTIEHVATVEVHATSGEAARKRATEIADAPNSNLWREGDVVDEAFKTTALRAGGPHCQEHCGEKKP